MLDYVIRSGTVLDGTGAPAREADVAIDDGRVVAVGAVDDAARTELDAAGLLVAPGVVDPHTHYDAQLFWDPHASPSNVHGVTTVIGGNCGFTLAPINAEDADYIRRMMAKVEGMPLTARAEEVATDDEIAAMRALLAESLEAGGLGFSSSQSRTHSDGEGNPITSRYADRREILAFCDEVANHEGTTLEYITNGCLDSFSPEEVDLMTTMSVTARRPLNWNVLTVDARSKDRIAHQLDASSAAAQAGGRIVALTMPTLVPMNMSFRTHCALFLIPGWGDVMGLPAEERIKKLADPATRADLDDLAHRKEAGVFRGLARWGSYVIGDTFAPANEGLAGRTVAEIAAERGTAEFDTLLDIVVADDLRTVLWPNTDDGDDDTWTARADIWNDPRAMVGGSDAGAHLDRMCGSTYPTAFLADCLRGRRLVSVEKAVHMMTGQPAALFGLRDRGILAPGMRADVFVFDPRTVASEPARLVHDLPGHAPRLTAGSLGVVRVLVNGVETVRDGVATGALPGSLLRSGADTRSVVPAAR